MMETATVEAPLVVKTAISNSMSHEERVSLALQSYGRREIYQTIDDIAAKAGIRGSSTYQAIYRMAKKGHLEIVTDMIPGTQRPRFAGVVLNKAGFPDEIIGKAAEKAKASPKLARKFEPKVSASLVNLNMYMEKKLAVEKAKELLRAAGVEAVIDFEEDPIGNEAIEILHELVDTKKQLSDLFVDVEANKRIENTK